MPSGGIPLDFANSIVQLVVGEQMQQQRQKQQQEFMAQQHELESQRIMQREQMLAAFHQTLKENDPLNKARIENLQKKNATTAPGTGNLDADIASILGPNATGNSPSMKVAKSTGQIKPDDITYDPAAKTWIVHTPEGGNQGPQWGQPNQPENQPGGQVNYSAGALRNAVLDNVPEPSIDRVRQHTLVTSLLKGHPYNLADSDAQAKADIYVKDVGDWRKAQTIKEEAKKAKAVQQAKESEMGGPKPVALQEIGTGNIITTFTPEQAKDSAHYIHLTEKMREEVNKYNNVPYHINNMNKYVNEAMISEGTTPEAFLNTKLGALQNKPAWKALHETAKPLTALAMSGVFGQNARGYKLIQDLQHSLDTDTGTVKSVVEQERFILSIAREAAAGNSYDTTKFDKALENLDQILAGKAPMTILPPPGKNKGRVIVGSDGSRKMDNGSAWVDLPPLGGK